MIAKVDNMVDQISHPENKAIMLCSICGNEYSANKGDYWLYKPNFIFTCCGTSMQLVTKHTVYRAVRKGR